MRNLNDNMERDNDDATNASAAQTPDDAADDASDDVADESPDDPPDA